MTAEELVLRIRQGELVLPVGWCLQSVGVGASSESVLINLEVGASSRLEPTKFVKNIIIYKQIILWFSPILGFHVKFVFMCIIVCLRI